MATPFSAAKSNPAIEQQIADEMRQARADSFAAQTRSESASSSAFSARADAEAFAKATSPDAAYGTYAQAAAAAGDLSNGEVVHVIADEQVDAERAPWTAYEVQDGSLTLLKVMESLHGRKLLSDYLLGATAPHVALQQLLDDPRPGPCVLDSGAGEMVFEGNAEVPGRRHVIWEEGFRPSYADGVDLANVRGPVSTQNGINYSLSKGEITYALPFIYCGPAAAGSLIECQNAQWDGNEGNNIAWQTNDVEEGNGSSCDAIMLHETQDVQIRGRLTARRAAHAVSMSAADDCYVEGVRVVDPPPINDCAVWMTGCRDSTIVDAYAGQGYQETVDMIASERCVAVRPEGYALTTAVIEFNSCVQCEAVQPKGVNCGGLVDSFEYDVLQRYHFNSRSADADDPNADKLGENERNRIIDLVGIYNEASPITNYRRLMTISAARGLKLTGQVTINLNNFGGQADGGSGLPRIGRVLSMEGGGDERNYVQGCDVDLKIVALGSGVSGNPAVIEYANNCRFNLQYDGPLDGSTSQAAVRTTNNDGVSIALRVGETSGDFGWVGVDNTSSGQQSRLKVENKYSRGSPKAFFQDTSAISYNYMEPWTEGSSDDRLENPSIGQVHKNTDTFEIEMWDGSAWT